MSRPKDTSLPAFWSVTEHPKWSMERSRGLGHLDKSETSYLWWLAAACPPFPTRNSERDILCEQSPKLLQCISVQCRRIAGRRCPRSSTAHGISLHVTHRRLPSISETACKIGRASCRERV